MIIKNLKDLRNLRLKVKNKKIGLCHGVFDILHEGHIEHLKYAKQRCDILLVSLTGDKFVKKGPLQPYQNFKVRSSIISNLKFVDYVFVNNELTSMNVINSLSPNLYFKGIDYKDKKDLTNNLKKEENALRNSGGKIVITTTKLKSSTNFINNKLAPWSESQKKLLKKIGYENNFDTIKNEIEKLSKLTVNIIGETIDDNFVITEVVGLTSKEASLSGIEKKKLQIPGGSAAIALMVAEFVKKVNFFTYGKKEYFKKIFKNKKNVNLVNLSNTKPIQKKMRFINEHRKQKIFQVSNFTKNSFNEKDRNSFIKILKKKILSHLMVCDFGCGLFEGNFLNYINNINSKKYINVQSNSLNFGYNLFTKYKKKNLEYISLDEKEWCLGFKINPPNYKDVLDKIDKNISSSITIGKKGSIFIHKKHKYFFPTLIDKVMDTTGCGDAYFSITTMLKMIRTSEKLLPFMGNIYAGMHSENLGNVIIKKNDYLKYVKSIINF